ncbi:MAG TPA: hypothetical protein VKG91_08870 [Roseiarcus sp.]|nr:hypothetical protein [Roseiarcus sp.]
MTRAKFIRDENELLDALRENPTRRAVAARRRDTKRREVCFAVVEFPTSEPRGDGESLAWINPCSAASALINRVHVADVTEDAAAWALLPLRHGPYYGTYVLPDHPNAPMEAFRRA